MNIPIAKASKTGKTISFLGANRSFSQQPAITSALKLDDLQNIVRQGYINCSRRTYFLRLDSEQTGNDKGLAALKERGLIPSSLQNIPLQLQKLTETVEKGCPNTFVDIGFTYAGLEKLKIRSELLEVFRRKSPAFHGNAFSRAQRHLGDTGLSAPQYWQPHYQDQVTGGGFHIVLIAHFPYVANSKNIPEENSACIQVFESTLLQVLLNLDVPANLTSPLSGSWIEVSVPLEKPSTEHFGYRDGITFPKYSEHAPSRDEKGYRELHALGEILLGQPRNDGDNLYADLGLTHKKNANIGLQKTPFEEEYKKFFKNSSFGVLRKMEQRVEYFHQWVEKQAVDNFNTDKAMRLVETSGDPYYLSKKWIRAKLIGRTPEGDLLTPNMTMKDLQNVKVVAKPLKEKGFHVTNDGGKPLDGDDSEGSACPFSSHIRRMNPRDDSVTPFIHRPVLRRGMPYTEGGEKGMSGLFICADIAEQFEHLLGVWANHKVLGIPDESTCKDPIIGNHEPQSNVLYLHSRPDHASKKNKVSFYEPFVITRGCAYVWFPTQSTLETLGSYTKLLPDV
jgi:deferrochelatase/peroxidase EfeB